MSRLELLPVIKSRHSSLFSNYRSNSYKTWSNYSKKSCYCCYNVEQDNRNSIHLKPAHTPITAHSIDSYPSSTCQVVHNMPDMASYLIKLFPECVCQPSIHILETLFQAIHIKAYYVAFIACLLDSLSEIFFLKWLSNSSRCHHLNKIVRPEVIVIGCISLSIKFLDDFIYPIKSFVTPFNQIMEFFSLDTVLSVNDMVRLEISILEDLEFDLIPLCSIRSLRYMISQFKR